MAVTPHAPEAVKRYLKSIGEWKKFNNYFTEDRPFKEMFAEFWERKDIMRVLNLPPLNLELNKKGDKESNKFRAEGNSLYKKKNFDKALLAYNYAVMSASHPEENYPRNLQGKKEVEGKFETLAMGFGSRSALLFEVGKYEECLKDIERAIFYGYPSDKMAKLIERRKKCLEKQTKEEVNIDISETAAAVKIDKYNYLFYRGSNCPEFIKCKNKERYHMVNKSVKAEYSSLKGRHLVASKNIEPGEILMVERAICSIPKLDSNIRSYCCVCLRKAPIVLPCSKCSLMAFCSDDCRQSPNNNHAVECFLLPILITSNTDEELGLVYRTLLKFTMEEINSELQTTAKKDLDRNDTKSLLHCRTSYLTLRNLEGNIGKRSSECYIETVANASHIVQLLQRTPEFWYRKDDNESQFNNDDETLKTLGVEVMTLLLNFQCNIHCIKELQINTKIDVLSADCYESGYGIFNTFSLMNHSCVPNVLHSNWGDMKFMYAISFIPQGEEIYDSYGERYVSHDLETRRRNLKEHYYFDCNCKACAEKWLTFNKLPKEFQLRCPQCDAPLDDSTSKCEVCKRIFLVLKTKEGGKKNKKKEQTDVYDSREMCANIEMAWKTYRTTYEEINRYKTSMGNIRKIGKYISLLSKYTCAPNAFLVEAQETLLRGFDLMGSYTFLSPKTDP